MEISKEIQAELKEICPFLGGGGRSGVPYTLPGGYFEDFPEILMNRIYFEAVAKTGQDSAQETAEISDLLARLQKKNPYQVPEGYFETLKVKIPVSERKISNLVPVVYGSSRSESKPKVKGISFLPRIIKYAVAACLIGLLGITIYNITNNRVVDPLHGLTTVSDQDMANYLDADDIHWTPGLTPETASVEFSDNDIHALFSNISDAELEQYHPELPLENGTVN